MENLNIEAKRQWIHSSPFSSMSPPSVPVPETPSILRNKVYRFLHYSYPPDYFEELLSDAAIEVLLEEDFCDKIDRHDEFIPVYNFSLDHLPLEIRHRSVYVWLMSVAPLVVKLKKNGHATGRIFRLVEDENKSKKCEDVHCQYIDKLGRNHKVYGGLGIITNRHVIKSDIDAAITRVIFSYNEENSPLTFSELGCSLIICDARFDYSVFSCFVHDKTLIETMKVLDRKRDYAWSRIPKDIQALTKKYAIIVSHPHGQPKKISIGYVKESEVRGKGELANACVSLLLAIYNICEKQEHHGLRRFEAYYKITLKLAQTLPFRITWYTTATCKGSSGAPVYMGNTVLENGLEKNQAHTHRGVDKNKNLNNCFT